MPTKMSKMSINHMIIFAKYTELKIQNSKMKLNCLLLRWKGLILLGVCSYQGTDRFSAAVTRTGEQMAELCNPDYYEPENEIPLMKLQLGPKTGISLTLFNMHFSFIIGRMKCICGVVSENYLASGTWVTFS